MITRACFNRNGSWMRMIILEGVNISSQKSFVWSVKDILEIDLARYTSRAASLRFEQFLPSDTLIEMPLGLEISGAKIGGVKKISTVIMKIIEYLVKNENLVDPYIADRAWAPEGTPRYHQQLIIKAKEMAENRDGGADTMDSRELFRRLARALEESIEQHAY